MKRTRIGVSLEQLESRETPAVGDPFAQAGAGTSGGGGTTTAAQPVADGGAAGTDTGGNDGTGSGAGLTTGTGGTPGTAGTGGTAGTTATNNGTAGTDGAAGAVLTPSAGARITPRLFGVGADTGGGPHVRVFNTTGQEVYGFYAFEGTFTGGTRVAVADFTGDGQDDIAVGAGVGGGPRVRVWDGASGQLVRDFFAFEEAVRDGVFLGAGDVFGDGAFELLVGAGPGGAPRVTVYDGRTLGVIRTFFGGDSNLRGGAYVGGGDLNGDGRAEVIVATGRFNPAFINVFDGATGAFLGGFEGYDEFDPDILDPAGRAAAARFGAGNQDVMEGIYLANAADLDGDGRAEIITGQVLSEPLVRAFRVDGLRGGAFGNEGDDGDDDQGGNTQLFDEGDVDEEEYDAFDEDESLGARPVGKDLNGDGRAELIVGSGPGRSEVRVLDGRSGDELFRLDAFPGFRGGVVVG